VPDTDLKINITTTGNPAGAEAVAKSLQGLGKAAGETGQESKSLGADLQSLGARQNATKDVIEGLDQAMKGQTASIFGVAKAAKNLWEVLTVSTPMGRLAQLAIIAAGAFSLFKEKLSSVEKPAEDTAVALQASVTAASKINQVRLDALKTELEAIGTRAKVASDSIDAIHAASDRLAKSRMTVELAGLAADGTLSPEDRAKKEYEIKKRFSADQAKRDDDKTSEQLGNAERKAKDLRDVADREFFTQKKSADGNLENTVGNRDNLNRAQKALRDFMGAELKRNGPLNAEANLRALEALLPISQALTERQNAAFGPEADARLSILRDRAESAGSGNTAASLAADKAEEELRVLRETASRNSYVNPVVRSNEDRAARIAAGISDVGSFDDYRKNNSVSEPAKLLVNGKDVTDSINRQMDQMRALGESAARLGKAIESSIIINGVVISQIEKTAENLESQIKASRR